MAIDLNRFSEPVEAVVPFIDKKSVYRGRKIEEGVEDGWYKVMIADNIAVLGVANQIEREMALQSCPILKGLPIGDQFFPLNFNTLEVLGFDQTAEVQFNEGETWDIIKAGLWEDGRFYFAGIDYGFDRGILENVRKAFEKDKSIKDISGTTPELRYYFIVLSLHRESHRKMQELAKMKLAAAEREKLLKEFRKTFSGRLEKIIKDAGGKLVRFSKKGKDKVVVVWKVGDQQIKTVIEDGLKIIDAGFCLSGEDKKHSLSSLIALAHIFKEDEPLYITRQ